LLELAAGTGRAVNNVPIGRPGSKERVDFGKVIGRYIDPVTGVASPTTKGVIVYDRKGGAHIIPARP
jgi:filamentous hemagglutinin